VEEIFVPAVGMAMGNAILLEWQKNPGDPLNAGDVIAIIGIDKTTMDIAAETSGGMGRHRYQINDEVPAGNAIAVILGSGESE